MGVGIGGGGFGVHGGVRANSRGVGGGVGVGPFSVTGSCLPSGCLGYVAWIILLVVGLMALVYIGPVVIAVVAGVALYRAKRNGDPLSGSKVLGLGAAVIAATAFSVWVWAYTIDTMAHTADVPRVSGATVRAAEFELRAAGFENLQVDYGSTSVVGSGEQCHVSGTSPEAYESADTRDPLTILVSYC